MEESGNIDYCKQKGIVFYGYMTLEQGALSGKYDTEHAFPDDTVQGQRYLIRCCRRLRSLWQNGKGLPLPMMSPKRRFYTVLGKQDGVRGGENVGMVLGTGCGSPSMTQGTKHMKDAYDLGKTI